MYGWIVQFPIIIVGFCITNQIKNAIQMRFAVFKIVHCCVKEMGVQEASKNTLIMWFLCHIKGSFVKVESWIIIIWTNSENEFCILYGIGTSINKIFKESGVCLFDKLRFQVIVYRSSQQINEWKVFCLMLTSLNFSQAYKLFTLYLKQKLSRFSSLVCTLKFVFVIFHR